MVVFVKGMISTKCVLIKKKCVSSTSFVIRGWCSGQWRSGQWWSGQFWSGQWCQWWRNPGRPGLCSVPGPGQAFHEVLQLRQGDPERWELEPVIGPALEPASFHVDTGGAWMAASDCLSLNTGLHPTVARLRVICCGLIIIQTCSSKVWEVWRFLIIFSRPHQFNREQSYGFLREKVRFKISSFT